MSDIDANAYTLHYQTENCNCSDTIAFDGCNSVMTYDLDDMPVESQGRVLQLNAKVRNICPGRRTAVMISLHELDQYGNEQPRGMKAVADRMVQLRAQGQSKLSGAGFAFAKCKDRAHIHAVGMNI